MPARPMNVSARPPSANSARGSSRGARRARAERRERRARHVHHDVVERQRPGGHVHRPRDARLPAAGAAARRRRAARHAAARTRVAEIELDGFPIVVTHGDQFGSPTPAKLHEAFPAAEIIVFGHSHRPLLELVDKTITVMNPGGAGAPRFGLAPSVGILELEPGIPPRGRIVSLK